MFHDIPLTGSCIVSIVDLMLGVGETPIPSLCNISVSFKIYDYLPISPIGSVNVNNCYIHCKR